MPAAPPAAPAAPPAPPAEPMPPPQPAPPPGPSPEEIQQKEEEYRGKREELKNKEEELRKQSKEKKSEALKEGATAVGMAWTGVGLPEAAAMAMKAKAAKAESERLAKQAREVHGQGARLSAPSAGVHAASSLLGSRFGQALLILMLGGAIYSVLNKLGVRLPVNAVFIVMLAVLGAVYRLYPEPIDKIFKFIAVVFGGFIGFILLAFFPLPLPHFVTTMWLVFYALLAFAIAGRRWGFVILAFNLIFFVPLLGTDMYASLFVPDTPLYIAIEGQQKAWHDMFSGVSKLSQDLSKGVQQSYLYALGDYENGVEANSEKPLGVFLENVGVTSPIVSKGEKADVYARLRADSFKTDTPLTINVRCYPDEFEDDKNDMKKQGKIVPKATFMVQEYESQDIDCLIDADELGEGATHRINLETSFTFTTSAYLKSYFMEQERIRAYRRQQSSPDANVLDSFGISDKNPVAVFTGGPLKVGMGAGQQPIALSTETAESEQGPTLGITLDKNWGEGDLFAVTSISITTPPGICIQDIDGKGIECQKGEGEHTYKLEGDVLKKIMKVPVPPVQTPKTIRAHTSITDMAQILANAPLAIRSFKVEVKYTYRIKKEVSVTVRAEKK